MCVHSLDQTMNDLLAPARTPSELGLRHTTRHANALVEPLPTSVHVNSTASYVVLWLQIYSFIAFPLITTWLLLKLLFFLWLRKCTCRINTNLRSATHSLTRFLTSRLIARICWSHQTMFSACTTLSTARYVSVHMLLLHPWLL